MTGKHSNRKRVQRLIALTQQGAATILPLAKRASDAGYLGPLSVWDLQPKDILGAIADWKLEAKLEDNHRYFYNTDEVGHLNAGSRFFVVGRKGTGKTAIREHLTQDQGLARYTDKLTFQNFPFNDLYAHSNDRFRPPNQYVTLWKWIIYCHVAKMMAKNPAIDGKIRDTFSKAFEADVLPTLARSVARLTSPEFRLSFLGLELTASARSGSEGNQRPWIDRCELLEQLIAKHADSSTYMLLFDELDDDFRSMDRDGSRAEYLSLITSLVKAAQDVRAVFSAPRYKIFPVIFLRDDIYDLIVDADKTKWNDSKVELTWSRDELRNLLAFRFARATDASADAYDPGEQFRRAFRGDDVSPARIKAFEYMVKRSLNRPRDIISFAQIAARIARDRNRPYLSSDAISSALEPYSTYLRSDIEDEISGSVPGIRNILSILATIRSPIFTANRFRAEYEKAQKAGRVGSLDPLSALDILFQFSIVGNSIDGGQRTVFRYSTPGARFDPSQEVLVLRGLYSVLQIREV